MRKNYNFGLTLGTGSNRDNEGDAYGIYLRKKFHSNNLYSYDIKDAYHMPTKKAIKEFGESNLHVVIFKNCKPAAKSKLKGFRWMYEAEQTIWMPLLEFKKLYGGDLPTLNSGGTIAKKLF